MRENSWVMRWFLYIRENGAGKRKKRRRDVSLRKLDWTQQQHGDVTKTSCTMSRDSPISRYPVCKYIFFRNELLSMLEGSKRVGKRTRDANRMGTESWQSYFRAKSSGRKVKKKEKKREKKEKKKSERPLAQEASRLRLVVVVESRSLL